MPPLHRNARLDSAIHQRSAIHESSTRFGIYSMIPPLSLEKNKTCWSASANHGCPSVTYAELDRLFDSGTVSVQDLRPAGGIAGEHPFFSVAMSILELRQFPHKIGQRCTFEVFDFHKYFAATLCLACVTYAGILEPYVGFHSVPSTSFGRKDSIGIHRPCTHGITASGSAVVNYRHHIVQMYAADRLGACERRLLPLILLWLIYKPVNAHFEVLFGEPWTSRVDHRVGNETCYQRICEAVALPIDQPLGSVLLYIRSGSWFSREPRIASVDWFICVRATANWPHYFDWFAASLFDHRIDSVEVRVRNAAARLGGATLEDTVANIAMPQWKGHDQNAVDTWTYASQAYANASQGVAYVFRGEQGSSSIRKI
ncbi:hypothetical protein C8R45DRAFT_921941 [Mycena sanguinolenta]|nr:hypothetical protein C8R45DRAFT_921941 [Mycena sanguinolenta]